MLVQFLTDDESTFQGFKAYFHYMPIEPNCANWLNMTTLRLESPDYPTIDCSLVITAPSTGSTIGLNFETFEVRYICSQKFELVYIYEQKILKFFSLGMMILI